MSEHEQSYLRAIMRTICRHAGAVVAEAMTFSEVERILHALDFDPKRTQKLILEYCAARQGDRDGPEFDPVAGWRFKPSDVWAILRHADAK